MHAYTSHVHEENVRWTLNNLTAICRIRARVVLFTLRDDLWRFVWKLVLNEGAKSEHSISLCAGALQQEEGAALLSDRFDQAVPLLLLDIHLLAFPGLRPLRRLILFATNSLHSSLDILKHIWRQQSTWQEASVQGL